MLKQDWFAAADDEIHPRLIPAGTVLTGSLLARARSLGLVEDPPDPSPPPAPRPSRTRKNGV